MNRLAPASLCVLLLSACAHGGMAYRPPPVEPVGEPSPQDDRAMYLALIRQMQDQGAYYASLAHVDAFRRRFGDTPELRLLEADALRETGNGDAAAALYRGLLRGPQAAPAWHGLGRVAAAAGKREDAWQALASAVRLEPLEPRYLGDLGFALLQAGRVAEARAPLAKAAELAPDNIRAVANLALWALLSDQPDVADAIMRRARLSEPVRGEIMRLYAALRTPASAPAAASPAPPVAAGDAASRPPGSMLERFVPSSDRPDEVLP
ncbi:tetratricopeptide repeat protein [Stenotrophomonas sp. MYb238]|uniref:tetratricopeptide repeat protein n=1 Tax=Stenotrophomonas sp. MYb238 TaxID=2040281 RepID=UPI00129263A8|nr:tetratricopeptide repeat protein [Stenotrophomonas sp. MYb238]MQP76126.1 tetratricopeptide repeat protein [Stenotrophomonas sp. MYb238]